jgi:hypothetical protein
MTAIVALFAILCAVVVGNSGVSAFSTTTTTTAFIVRSSKIVRSSVDITSSPTLLYSSEPEKEDEEGLDLNLEEMFDM